MVLLSLRLLLGGIASKPFPNPCTLLTPPPSLPSNTPPKTLQTSFQQPFRTRSKSLSDALPGVSTTLTCSCHNDTSVPQGLGGWVKLEGSPPWCLLCSGFHGCTLLCLVVLCSTLAQELLLFSRCVLPAVFTMETAVRIEWRRPFESDVVVLLVGR